MTFGAPPIAAAAAMSLGRLGQRTRVVETNPSATTSIARLLTNNPNRVEFTLVNLGTAPVYVSQNNAPSATNGYYIVPQGGMTVLIDEDGEQVAYDWYVISSSGTQQLFVSEVIAD